MKKILLIAICLLFATASGFTKEGKISFDQAGGITELVRQAKQNASDLIGLPVPPKAHGKVKELKKWTVMFYMANDNDTEEWGVYELDALEAVGSNANVNIVAQLDRAAGFVGAESNDGDWTGAKRFYVIKDTNSEVGQTQQEFYDTSHVSTVVQDIGEVNMGSTAVLKDFVLWGMQNYPAERYALVMMSHGTGYKSVENTAVKSTNYDDTGGSMATSAIKDALKNLPYKLDLIDFKACLMGMVETAYEVKDYAKVMTATEEMSWTPAWPAEKVMKDLVDNPDMGGVDLSKRIVYHYGNYMDNDPQHKPHPNSTYSAIDLVQVEELAKSLDTLAGSMIAAMPAAKPVIKEARAKTQKYYFAWHADFQNFAELLAAATTDEAIKSAALKVVEQNKKAVIAEYHGPKAAGSRGLAIYFPSDYTRSDYTNSLGFVRNYRWDEFVKKYFQKDDSSDLKIPLR